MEIQISAGSQLALLVTKDEILTLRHCVIEALEALSDEEFRIRTGAGKMSAELLLSELKRASRALPEPE